MWSERLLCIFFIGLHSMMIFHLFALAHRNIKLIIVT